MFDSAEVAMGILCFTEMNWQRKRPVQSKLSNPHTFRLLLVQSINQWVARLCVRSLGSARAVQRAAKPSAVLSRIRPAKWREHDGVRGSARNGCAEPEALNARLHGFGE